MTKTTTQSNVILSRLRRLNNSSKVSFMYNNTRRTAYVDTVDFNKSGQPYVKVIEQNKGYRTYSVENMSSIRSLKSN